jgi:glycopeptide antibiotics resistance protein
LHIIKQIITNVLIALYQPFWFAILISIFFMFFYLYANKPIDTGKGWKQAVIAWIGQFKTSSFFRRWFFLSFYTVMILFRTLLNRNMWANPLSDVMGGWWIWKANASTGEVTLTTECFENLVLMIPFTTLLIWTAKNKILKKIHLSSTLWTSTKVAFLFSAFIEFLQLFLRLGTFQLSDLFYNTMGGTIGGLIYWFGLTLKSRKAG